MGHYTWTDPGPQDIARSLVARLAKDLEETVDAWSEAEGDGHKIADIDLDDEQGDTWQFATRQLLDEAQAWLQQ